MIGFGKPSAQKLNTFQNKYISLHIFSYARGSNIKLFILSKIFLALFFILLDQFPEKYLIHLSGWLALKKKNL
jgi:hypothetical protein